LHLAGFYDGNPAHNVVLYQYNFDILAWQSKGTIPQSPTETIYELPLLSDADYVDNGNVRIMIVHESPGNPVHQLHIDEMRLDPHLAIYGYDNIFTTEFISIFYQERLIDIFENVQYIESLNVIRVDPDARAISVFEDLYTTESVTLLITEYYINIFDTGYTTESVTLLIPEYLVNIFEEVFTTEDVTTVRIDVGFRDVNIFEEVFTTESVQFQIPILIPFGELSDITGDILNQDAETGDTSGFTSIYQTGGTFTAETEAACHGNYGYKCLYDGTPGENDIGFVQVISAEDEVYARMYFYISSDFESGANDIWDLLVISYVGSGSTNLQIQNNSSNYIVYGHH